MKKVILHIGTGKTGTTSIQNFLHANRVRLREACDLDYPDFGLRHVDQLDESIDAHYQLSTWLQKRRADKAAEMAAVIRKSPCSQVIFSCENFYHHLFAEEIAFLAEFLRPFRVEILCYVRRQDLYIESAWKQQVKVGEFKVSFADFLEHHASAAALEGAHANYLRMLGAWRDVFGIDAMHTRVFDRSEMLNGDLLDDFLEACGLAGHAGTGGLERPAVSNVGLPSELMGLVRLANLYQVVEKERHLDFVRFLQGATAFANPPLAAPRERLAVVRNYEASNRMLFAEYLGRDLPPLFSSRANDLSAPAPNAAPRAKARSAEELAIRALAGIWRGGAGPGHAAGAAEVAAARKAAPAPVPEWRRRPLATVAAPDFAAALAERGIATADCLVFVPPAGAGPASADAVPLEACGPFHALDFPRPTLFAGDVRISPPAAVVLVRDATVTAGRLDAEARTVHGAIYDASGNLLVDATRRGVSPQHAADADRLAQTRMVRARRTGGLAVYLGWLTEGLSGFLLESVARLYVVPALRDMNPCFVMHPLGARVALDSAFDKDFVRESMAAFGIARDDILLVDRDRHFDNLLVPPAQLLRGIGAGPRQREVIERIAAHCLAGVPAAPSRRRIFFSRADSADGSEPVNGKELAAMFASHGFDIVDPDATGFVGQVAQLASADMLAGCSDPSLYMASFLPADASLLCLCPGEITRNQVLIGCVRDTKTRYIRAADGKPAGGGPRGTWRADIPRIEAHLVQMLAAAGAG